MKTTQALLAVALLAGLCLPAAAAPIKRSAPAPQARVADPGAAIILSSLVPGLGESYNAGWKLGFPWVECIVGSICPFFRFTSMIDAASGEDKDQMRFDFWSLPD